MSLLAVTSGDIASGVVEAEGVDFDGTYDYLSRSTDLVGNVDSKMFTFSAWVYRNTNTQSTIYMSDTTYGRFYIFINASDQVQIIARNTSNTIILNATINTIPPILTFFNILVSVDLSTTANRCVYINDVLQSVTWTTYSNISMDFTNATHKIWGASQDKGRLSNVFLDYTYRDLSIEANRRLFITADGKPADWNTTKALNGILMIQMKDAATAHINDGYGGSFTANGTFATSNRGANQDNCVASYFDGSADYLSRNTALVSITDGKVFSLSFSIEPYAVDGAYYIFGTVLGRIEAYFTNSPSNGTFRVTARNSSGVAVLDFYISNMVAKKNYNISLSVDLANSSNRKIFVDGVEKTATWVTYTNANIDFTETSSPYFTIGRAGSAAGYFNGNIGELYFDTKYIDLATNNPFWDTVENKPVPVRKVIASTGVTPLIAMPLDASNAGKNYGTGGDFTANSAPYVGARGASEFWARSAKSDGATGRLSRGNIPTLLDSKTVSCVCAIYLNSATTYDYILSIGDSGTLPNFKIMTNGTTMWVDGSDSTYTRVMQNSFSCTTGQWLILFASFDLANTSNRYLSLNGVVSSNWSTYINAPLGFTGHSEVNLFNDYVANTANIADACIGSMYFTTSYIDFSQEVNRLKFVDAFNMPLDLASQIDKGIIPKPLIYLPFDDPTNLGKNLGTGGDFTVNGTITAGADVLG